MSLCTLRRSLPFETEGTASTITPTCSPYPLHRFVSSLSARKEVGRYYTVSIVQRVYDAAPLDILT